MPRIWPVSDLHQEYVPWEFESVPAYDIAVFAGDTSNPLSTSVSWVADRFGNKPAIVVPGNHDFWKTCLPDEVKAAKAVAAERGIHLLIDDEVILEGVRFLGGSLWTDYRLLGSHLEAAAKSNAFYEMRDHKRIKWSKDPWMRFRPMEAQILHSRTERFLKDALDRPFHGPTVIVTHHAPHILSIMEKERDKLISAAYASDMTHLLDGRAKLWIHGHTHLSVDYDVGGTRILSNPFGYNDADGRNRAFNPMLTVEV